MRDERLTRIPNLAAMRLLTELIGADEQVTIELLVQRMLVLAPSRNKLPLLPNRRCRCRHSRPASAKLVYRPRPTIMWSCTGISSKRPAATSCSVTARSSADGVGSPLG